eukprot:TRINITY_DN7461_c0_g1_i9.p1 TRINITY_DN7461_c0_g1~~TRINITY_DN7461_c0_g1_i9.p1  ORF type:complete len:526 (+),score=92.45 TRINITY_DN7461_c0_g1_i9:78-1580(+)
MLYASPAAMPSVRRRCRRGGGGAAVFRSCFFLTCFTLSNGVRLHDDESTSRLSGAKEQQHSERVDAQVSSQCLCTEEDLAEELKEVREENGGADEKMGQRTVAVVKAGIDIVTKSPKWQRDGFSSLGSSGHLGAYAVKQTMSVPFKVAMQTGVLAAVEGIGELALAATWGTLFLSLAAFQMLLLPTNFAMFYTQMVQKAIAEAVDNLRDLPHATQDCALAWEGAMKQLVEGLLKATNEDMAVIGAFLEEPGVRECSWQPTSAANDYSENSKWNPWSNDGLYVYHGKEAVYAPGMDVFGHLIGRINKSYTDAKACEVRMNCMSQEEYAWCYDKRVTEKPDKQGRILSCGGADPKTFKELLTNHDVTPELRRHHQKFDHYGVLNRYSFAKSAYCKDSGGSAYEAASVERLIYRTMAMFLCQLKKWHTKHTAQSRQVLGSIVDKVVEKMGEEREQEFKEELRKAASLQGVAWDVSETTSNILLTAATAETGQSIVEFLIDAVR